MKLTFNPFALLMALNGLNTRNTLKIFIKDTWFEFLKQNNNVY